MFETEHCKFIMRRLNLIGYKSPDDLQPGTWRVAPSPLHLTAEQVQWLQNLGPHLGRFTQVSNQLYLDSASGRAPGWISQYLDLGKPSVLVDFQRSQRIRNQYPAVIRPDIIPTKPGMIITELDSVPGGMGVLGRLVELYQALGHQTLTGDCSIMAGFAAMIRAVAKTATQRLRAKTATEEVRLAVIVSSESEDYRTEMTWLAAALRPYGVDAVCVKPEDLWYSKYRVSEEPFGESFDVVYRFFELFDLPNISGAERLMALNQEKRVAVIPPFRPLFEEKLSFALFHHPVLATVWKNKLGAETFAFLRTAFPATWILDPAAIPPNATIPGLTINNSGVSSWSQLQNLGRSQRRFVVKPSGFSELSWGSRGVSVGHDLSTTEWNNVLDNALGQFPKNPHILQEFHSGQHFECQYFAPDTQSVKTIQCRARLCPYYFMVGNEVLLTSVLATLCPLDKKKIHGMSEAIYVPCDISSGASAHPLRTFSAMV